MAEVCHTMVSVAQFCGPGGCLRRARPPPRLTGWATRWNRRAVRTRAELGGLAVVFHRLADDQRGLLDYLDTSLSAAMPEAVRVQRDHMFNRGRANHVEILLGGRVFDLRLEHGADHVVAVATWWAAWPCRARRAPSRPGSTSCWWRSTPRPGASDSVRAALAKLT